MAAWLGAGAAAAQVGPQDRLADVEQKLEATREEAALYADDVSALTVRLAELERELVARAADVQRQEAALTAIETQIASLETQESERSQALAQRKDAMATVVSALVRLARHPPEALLAMPGTVVQVRHTGILLASLVPGIEAEVSYLGRELAALARLRQDLDAGRAERSAVAAELDTARERTAALMAETAALRADRLQERDAAAARAAALAAEAADLRALILALSAASAEPGAADVAPAPSAEGAAEPTGPEYAPLTVAAGPGLAPLPRPKPGSPAALATVAPAAGVAVAAVDMEPAAIGVVAALEPALRLPAAGTIERGFGDLGADGMTSRGLVIATRPDAQVVAPSGGAVVYAGAYKNLGQLLIIAHGDEYHSVLAGFARIDAAVGQDVVAGEPVGVMGAEGSGGTSLYVELRHGGEPVDPVPWLRTAFSKDGG